MAKKPDKLAQDVHQAIAAGMSYGKWKAMQGHTEPTEKQSKGNETICLNCGKVIVNKDKFKRKYCDAYCGIEYRYKKAKGQLKEGTNNG